MSRTRPPFPSDFRQHLVELVQSGRSPEGLHRLRQENRRLREGREIPAKATALVRSGGRRGVERLFMSVEINRSCHRVATMCRVLGVSPSGYYAWRQHGPSPRPVTDAAEALEMAPWHRRVRPTAPLGDPLPIADPAGKTIGTRVKTPTRTVH